MATSGSFNTNSTSWSDSYGTLTSYVNVAWAQVGQQDITNNTTTIRITCTVYTNMAVGYKRGYYTKRLTVDGQTVDDTTYITRGNGEVLWTRDFTISHTADGSKSFSISFAVCVGQNNTWTLTGSGTYTLNTIPRASSMSMSPANPATTSTITASIERAVSSFKHTITTAYNGTSYNLTGSNKVDTSATFTIPTGIRSAMASNNVASVVLPITLTTYNGDNAIGQKDYSLTVSVPTATVSVGAASVKCTENISWTLGKVDTTAAKYTVTRSYNGTTVYTDQTKSTTTSKTNAANALFEPKITTSSSGIVEVKVTTYAGTTEVGSSTTTYTVTIPTEYYKPIVTAGTLTARHDKAYTPIVSLEGKFLAGYDGASWTVTESKSNNSSAAITGRTVAFSINGRATYETPVVSGNKVTIKLSTFARNAEDYNLTITYTATDARGGFDSCSVTAVVKGYSSPVITSAIALRATSAGVEDAQGVYGNISASTTAHNTSTGLKSIVIKTGTTTVATKTNSSEGTYSSTASVTKYHGIGDFLITNEYSFVVTATDYLDISSTRTFVMPKATVTLSLHKQNGLGFGTVAETGKAVFGVDPALNSGEYALGNWLINNAPTVTNLNDISTGIAQYNTATANRPSNYGVCISAGHVGSSQTNWIFQVAFDTNGYVFTRRCINDTSLASWTSWTSGAIIPNLTVAGNIGIWATSVDASKTNNNISSMLYPTSFNVTDVSGRIVARLESVINPNGSIGVYLYARNYNTSGTQVAQKGLRFHMNKSGALSWSVSDPDNFVAAIKSSLVNAIYPVGAVYISASSTSPATLFGGTWEQIKGRFLLSTGKPDDNSNTAYGTNLTYNGSTKYNETAGSTGGESLHTLTIAQMPSHSHTLESWVTKNPTGGRDAFLVYGMNSGTPQSVKYYQSPEGGGGAHNNMPPYLVVYMWKRTA